MLTAFDIAVIAYAQERGVLSELIYGRIDALNGRYRERMTEAELVAILDKVKEQDLRARA
jgi:hypothetical protein